MQEKTYEKTIWEDGKTLITANLLNKVEDKLVDLDSNVKTIDSQIKDKANNSEVRKNTVSIQMKDLHTDVKSAMTGGSVAVVGINSVGNENIKLGSISPSQTDFITIGKNLFDKSKISEKGWYMQYTDGVPESNIYVTELCYSDYMPVTGNEKYIINEYIHSYCIFDGNKKFVSGEAVTKKGAIVTIPDNGAYLVINLNYIDAYKVQTEQGEISTAYEPFSYNLKDAKINYDVEELKTSIADTNNELSDIKTSIYSISSYKDISIDTGTVTTPRDATSTFTGWAIPFNKSELLDDITYISLYATAYDNSSDKNVLSNVPVNLELLDENRNVIKILSKGFLVESGKIEFNLLVSISELPDVFYIGLRATTKCVLMLYNCIPNPNYSFGDRLMFYSVSYSSVANGYSISNTNFYGTTDIKICTGVGLRVPEHKHKADDLEELPTHRHSASDIDGLESLNSDTKVKLNMPDKYELVVGDTFELFYKGILLCNNPYNYNFKITCNKGAYYSKRYIFTPASSDVGTHNLGIKVYDDNEKLLDSKVVQLIVKNKPSNPSSIKNVLCVGDSLTSGGAWPSEVCRRLTGIGGSPSGDALSNVKFIGSLSGTNGAKYEGYGGWTYGNYNSNQVSLQQYWINTTANKNKSYQKSVWKDVNNIEWTLETLESARIKVYRKNYGTQMLPSSGTLTWVSGGDGSDNNAISYTSYIAESGNPFWDDATNRVDFSTYATKIGTSSIDYCYVLLGWNQTGDTEAEFKDGVRLFINNLLTSFPNCKIVLMGLQVPSLDGFGANYGCSWNYYDKLKVVFNMNKWNYELSNEFSNVDFINIAGQFDSENNIITSTRQVNVRNSKTEIYGSNGVHPAYEGSMQIADAVYRNMIHKLHN